MDKTEVDRWLRAYVEAWKSYDPDQIGELFAEDVKYRYHPYDDPVEGRDAVVRSWLGDAAPRPGIKKAPMTRPIEPSPSTATWR